MKSLLTEAQLFPDPERPLPMPSKKLVSFPKQFGDCQQRHTPNLREKPQMESVRLIQLHYHFDWLRLGLASTEPHCVTALNSEAPNG